MKKIFILFVPLILFSCTTSSLSYRNSKTLDVTGGHIFAKPLICDLRVDMTRKANGEAGGKLDGAYNQDYFKSQALANAIVSSGCDVLVEPVFQVEVTNGYIRVNVTGRPGFYENVRPVEPKNDLQYLDFYRKINGDWSNDSCCVSTGHIPYYAPQVYKASPTNQAQVEKKNTETISADEQAKKKKKAGKIVGGVLGGIALLGLMIGVAVAAGG